MSPYGMHLLNVCRALWFSPTKVSGMVVMKYHVAIEQNHCVARVGAGEWLSDNDVAWLCILHGYLIEAIDLHIGEIEIFSPQPPSVSPPEVRQVDAAKMICVPEKRVAIHNAVVEPAPQQEWHRPVFPQLPARCKPPWQPRHYLHLPVST